eukprot:TRINITY_DN777912_c0_g1_i1.p1 TRINITY_DN777912_c0_g1~~TRINITY_DN777912_c0_g1_i1.p1  ORF type:complete len:403 (+),score=82.90 TRINITY_DN777912_c0_g1_i1:78-1286(+)
MEVLKDVFDTFCDITQAISRSEFSKLVNRIRPSDFDEIKTERNAYDVCGYPICKNVVVKKGFCSAKCHRCFLFVRGQLSDVHPRLRELSTIEPVVLFDADIKKEEPIIKSEFEVKESSILSIKEEAELSQDAMDRLAGRAGRRRVKFSEKTLDLSVRKKRVTIEEVDEEEQENVTKSSLEAVDTEENNEEEEVGYFQFKEFQPVDLSILERCENDGPLLSRVYRFLLRAGTADALSRIHQSKKNFTLSGTEEQRISLVQQRVSDGFRALVPLLDLEYPEVDEGILYDCLMMIVGSLWFHNKPPHFVSAGWKLVAVALICGMCANTDTCVKPPFQKLRKDILTKEQGKKIFKQLLPRVDEAEVYSKFDMMVGLMKGSNVLSDARILTEFDTVPMKIEESKHES